MSIQKPVMNGVENGPSVTGFRHQLPQMPVMSRNPKIAQSKNSSKEEIGIVEHSTMEVEGVGKVVHIGSELMDADDSPEEKLLQQLENCSDLDGDKHKIDSPEGLGQVANGHIAEPAKAKVENKTSNAINIETLRAGQTKNIVVNDLDNISTNKEDKQLDNALSICADQSETKNKEAEGIIEQQSINTNVKTSETSKRGGRRSSRSSKEEDSIVSPKTAKKPRLSAEIAKKETVPANVSAEDAVVSPGSKRLRKPKKMAIENEEVQKSPKPKSVPEKVVKPKADVDVNLEAKFPVKWLVGDLVWAKVSGHPWWPCMISYDPYKAIYTRVSGGAFVGREYHVQFFGDAAERGWISMKKLLEFEGKAKFDEYVEELYRKAKNKKEEKSLKKWYGVPASRAAAVNIGILSAEEALPLSRNERKANYTFVYKLGKGTGKEFVSIPDKKEADELAEDVRLIKDAVKNKERPESEKKQGRKRKLDQVSTPGTPKHSAKRQKVETPEVEKTAKVSKKSPTKKRLSLSEVSFEVYCQKERDSVLKEHPDFDEDAFLDYCRQQWCRMSKQQKARYKSRFSAEKRVGYRSDMSPPVSPSRYRKPSKKLIEAEEDNKAVDEVLLNQSSEKKPVKSQSKRQSLAFPQSSKRQSLASPMTSKKQSLGCPQSSKRQSLASPVTSKRQSLASPQPPRGNQKKADESEKKQRRKSQVEEETDLKQDLPVEEKEEIQALKVHRKSLLAAKRRSRKSTVDTDTQSESGRSTPSLPDTHIPPRKEKDDFVFEPEIYKLSSAGPSKKENLCQICEQVGELLECQGPCQGFFHIDCLGLSKAPADSFKCDECTIGIHSCFVCKKSDASTVKCSVPLCGKYYHLECIEKLPQTKIEGKTVQCPLHVCHTCVANNAKCASGRANGRLLRCIRCPTAYHVGDFCIAAGSINLTGFNIVCAKHFQPLTSQKHHSHVNVSWCFNCNKGGTLLCCESCPAAFHAECLKIDWPTGSWYCQDCVNGKRPLYGELVWVKLGNYRWWPGEICHPRNVPLNIQEKAHQVGEFPVHFLGSHDYFWLHQGRVFSFQDGDKGNINFQSAKSLAKHFSKGLKEAAEAYRIWKEFKDNKEQLVTERLEKKPAPFKMVKTNVPLGSVTIYKADPSELPPCECKPEDEDPCGMTSNCLNHMMMYECHPSLCPVGEKCQNQFFTKRLYPQQQPFKTEGRGWGLQALADIKKGQFVNEYVGDLIDEEECKRRLRDAHEKDISNFYMMTLDSDRIIDAGPKGNLSRFMNHSCQPNLETQKWTVNGDVRVGLFALKEIKAGDELTFNYNFDCLGNEKTKCCCGAENCSGFLGVRPKTHIAALAEAKKKDPKTKKKKKVAVKKKHEDFCFRCWEGGELVMCDRNACPKSYHLSCLGLNKPPYGKWDCPWHHCDLCGKPATHKCEECPNSFCAAHSEHIKTFNDKTYCSEHDESILELTASTPDNASETEPETVDVRKEETTKSRKSDKNSNLKLKEDEIPSKKRGSKQLVDKDAKINSIGANEKGGKGSKGKKGSGKGVNGTNGHVSDDPLAVAPMFDDSEDEEFGLVIDIPNFE